MKEAGSPILECGRLRNFGLEQVGCLKVVLKAPHNETHVMPPHTAYCNMDPPSTGHNRLSHAIPTSYYSTPVSQQPIDRHKGP